MGYASRAEIVAFLEDVRGSAPDTPAARAALIHKIRQMLPRVRDDGVYRELALSPVGLSLVTKLAPAKVVGFMMGFWFLSSAIGLQAGKWIAGETAGEKNATPQESLDLALGVFNDVGIFALGSGVLLLLLSPILRKWMHGVR